MSGKEITFWGLDSKANDSIVTELQGKGYVVERKWSSDREPVVSDHLHVSRGYSNIYESFLTTPIRPPST